MALPRKPGREAGSRPLSPGRGRFAQEGTTWKEPHGENHPQLRYVPPGPPSCQPLRGRPAAALTRDRPTAQAAVCWVCPAAPEGGFEVASEPGGAGLTCSLS